MAEAWIIDACRTPRGIGKVGKGALADIHPQQLGATVLRGDRRAQRPRHRRRRRRHLGHQHAGRQAGRRPRPHGRRSTPATTSRASGVTLDRFCGSGITAANLAAASIMSGMEDLVIAGGTEMMSLLRGERERSNRSPFMDAGNAHLRALHPQTHQGVCADAIATLEGISREALDELAAESQRRAAVAIAEGRFDTSLVPVLPRRRHAGPRPRGVPPPADHAGVARRAGPVVRGDRRLPARRGRAPPSAAGAAPVPRPRDRARAPRRQLLRRGRRRRRGAVRQPGLRQGPRPEAPRPRAWPSPTSATTRR